MMQRFRYTLAQLGEEDAELMRLLALEELGGGGNVERSEDHGGW